MTNIITRTITGILFVVLIVGSVLFSQISFGILFLAFTVIGLYEFYSLAEKGSISPQKITGIILGIIFYVSNMLVAEDVLGNEALLINILLPFIVFATEIYRHKENPFVNVAFTLLGLIYVVIPFSLLNYFYKFGYNENNSYILLCLFGLIWINDVFAYLCGITIGRHKLFERISPKKTWEGFVGGTLFCVIAAIIISGYISIVDSKNMLHWIVIAVIVAVAGVIGDLAESVFKRSVGVKDSGNIMPGHGGILDRFDSLLLSAPFVFLYIIFLYVFSECC